MEKRIVTISLILSMLLLSGCDKFLERKAQNLVVPTTCEQLKEMLQGDGYFLDIVYQNWWMNLMTDDIAYTSVVPTDGTVKEGNSIITYRLVHQWDSEIESEANNFYDTMFAYYYNQILVANIVLDNIDNISGSDKDREILRGQALFQRAFGYFYLASLYSDVYSEANLDKPCVPLKLTSTPSTSSYARQSIGRVWGQIRTDIDTSVKCLKNHSIANIYEINAKAALIMAMRVALNMQDFDAVIDYGKQLFALNDKLYDITTKGDCVTNDNSLGSSDVVGFISSNNPEIVWLYGSKSYSIGTQLSSLVANVFFAVSEDLISLYNYNTSTQSGDHRLPYFFIHPNISSLRELPNYYYCYNIFKYDDEDGYNRANSLRTGEAYLMMAEAYARRSNPDLPTALNYLNTLRRNRIDHYTDLTSTDLSTVDAVVKFVFDERRRELCFEELHRWWDLRRMGKPAMEHKWANGVVYRMNEGDDGYILDFPLSERTYDPSNANPRPIRTPIE